MNKKISILLFVLALVLYGNTLTHDFALDDHIVITGNNFTKKGFSGIKDIMTHDAFVGTYGEALELTGGRYRPLSIVMFAIEYQLFGLNPLVGHMMNVLLFAITGGMIFLLMIKLLGTKNIWVPLITASLFVVHPIHTEVVANIKSRDEILGLLLSLSVIWVMLKDKPFLTYALAPLLFFMALLSKENAITFMAIIPLTFWFFTGQSLKKICINMIPLLLVSVIYLVMRASFAGIVGDRVTTDIMDDPYLRATFSEKYATITYTISRYLGLLVFPHPLSADYSYNEIPLIGWGTAKALLSGALTLGVLGYAMKGLREKSLITYGILIFFITFSIVSNAIFNVGTSMADRFMYLPSLGFCIGIAAVLALLFKIKSDELISFKFRWVVPVVLLLLAGSYKTIARNKIWKNNFELYQEDVKNAPNSARIHLYYGIELIGKHGRSGVGKYLDMAIEEISRSVKINPDFHHAHYNLAVAYEKAERFDEAIACYLNTLALQPQHIKGNLNIGLLYGKVKKDYASAIFYFSKLLNSNYRTAYLYDNLGIAYAMNGNLTKAAEIFQKGIEYNPNSSKLHLNMAITLDNLGRKAESKAHYDRAFALDPKSRRSNTSGE